MTYNQKQKEYTIKYAREKLKRIPLDVQLTDYETIRKAAAAQNESINGYIKKAIFTRRQSDTLLIEQFQDKKI